MLEFFRKHQRIFLIFVTIVIVTSFSFFGTYSAIGSFEHNHPADSVVTHAIDGSKITVQDVRRLSKLLSAEKDHSGYFSLLLKAGVLERLATAYAEHLHMHWQERLDRLKRMRFYVHPQAPMLSARHLWSQLAPEVLREIETLQKEERVSSAFFRTWAHLYRMQEQCPPELIKRVLLYQQTQWRLPPDPKLLTEDFSLCGYRTIQEWFGRPFFDLTAQLILNGAAMAKQQGIEVSKREASDDFDARFDLKWVLSAGIAKSDAVALWQKALAFLYYIEGVGKAVLVESFPYQQFAQFAGEVALIDLYRLPEELQLKTVDDLLAYETYVQVATESSGVIDAFPQRMRTVEEVKRLAPELIFTPVRLQMAKVDLHQLGNRLSMKEVWEWQLSHWAEVQDAFPGLAADEPLLRSLEKMDGAMRSALDDWSRAQLVLHTHPEWIEQAFAAETMRECELKVFEQMIDGLNVREVERFRSLLFAEEAPTSYQEQGILYRFANRSLQEETILSFAEAKTLGRIPVERLMEEAYRTIRGKMPSCFREANGEWKELQAVREEVIRQRFATLFRRIDEGERKPLSFYVEHRFESLMQRAWGGEIPSGVWNVECIEQKIPRTASEEWMMKMPFVLQAGEKSPIYVPQNGDIIFFFVKEKQIDRPRPILEQIQLGQEVVAADAKQKLTDLLLEAILSKQAISMQTEEDHHDNL